MTGGVTNGKSSRANFARPPSMDGENIYKGENRCSHFIPTENEEIEGAFPSATGGHSI